jgi:hypothetical protein
LLLLEAAVADFAKAVEEWLFLPNPSKRSNRAPARIFVLAH